MSIATLVILPDCPNCIRLVGILKELPNPPNIKIKHLMELSPQQRQGINFVPALFVRATGAKLEGTNAFKWVDQFVDKSDMGGFEGFDPLPCADLARPTVSHYGDFRQRMAPLDIVKPYLE